MIVKAFEPYTFDAGTVPGPANEAALLEFNYQTGTAQVIVGDTPTAIVAEFRNTVIHKISVSGIITDLGTYTADPAQSGVWGKEMCPFVIETYWNTPSSMQLHEPDAVTTYVENVKGVDAVKFTATWNLDEGCAFAGTIRIRKLFRVPSLETMKYYLDPFMLNGPITFQGELEIQALTVTHAWSGEDVERYQQPFIR